MLANQFPKPAESAEEEKEQHIASLAFHSKLSDFGKNKLLGFIIGFMSQILTELTLYKSCMSHQTLNFGVKVGSTNCS